MAGDAREPQRSASAEARRGCLRGPATGPSFVPFLDYSPGGDLLNRRIESLHAQFRRATPARGHFPNERADTKRLCLVVSSLDPTGSEGDSSAPSRGDQHDEPARPVTPNV